MRKRIPACTLLALAWMAGHSGQAAEKITFTARDEGSRSGCVIEYRVKAQGNLARVEALYLKQARLFGKKDGAVQTALYDFKNRTVTYLDTKKHTYLQRKNPKLGHLALLRMIRVLELESKAKSFLGKKSNKGTIFSAATLSTTVTAAAKKAKFDDAELRIPKAYTDARKSTLSGRGLIRRRRGSQVSGADGSNVVSQ